MGSTEEGNKKFLILFLFMLRLCFGNSGLLCRAKMLIFCLIQCCFLLRLYERVKSARPHYSSGGPRGQVAITIAFILVKLIKLFNKQLSLYIYISLWPFKSFLFFFFLQKNAVVREFHSGKVGLVVDTCLCFCFTLFGYISLLFYDGFGVNSAVSAVEIIRLNFK